MILYSNVHAKIDSLYFFLINALALAIMNNQYFWGRDLRIFLKVHSEKYHYCVIKKNSSGSYNILHVTSENESLTISKQTICEYFSKLSTDEVKELIVEYVEEHVESIKYITAEIIDVSSKEEAIVKYPHEADPGYTHFAECFDYIVDVLHGPEYLLQHKLEKSKAKF
jgi:hypothetical protein